MMELRICRLSWVNSLKMRYTLYYRKFDKILIFLQTTLQLQNMEDNCQFCSKCGNNHTDSCSTEISYFFWYPTIQDSPPQIVQIAGSWHQWQSHLQMTRETGQNDESYFIIGIGLPVGRFQYKYIVDGKWKYDASGLVTDDGYGGYNNYIDVLPKAAVKEYHPKQDIKLTSSLGAKGLKIVGSWDNWQSETKMDLIYNNLKGCFEKQIFSDTQCNLFATYSQFSLKNQHLIDWNYPTFENQLGLINNRIYVRDVMSTPTRWRTNKSLSHFHNFTCKAFEWEKVVVDSEISFHKQLLEGHSICQIGEYLYIFGGRLRNDFTNVFVKVNIHRLNTFMGLQIYPQERAFHYVAPYGNKMILFGGHNKAILQDYCVFDTINSTWQTSTSKITGKFPLKIQNQSCVIYQDSLIFFGGYLCSPDFQVEKTFNEISVLDLKLMKWIDPELLKVQVDKPEGRYLHTATTVLSNMYVFGGKSHNDKIFGDLWMLGLEEVSNFKWQQLKPKGKPPLSRYGHTCNAIEHFLIIFGGTSQKPLNDVVVYDTQKNEWIYPIIKSQHLCPSPRFFHAASTMNNECIVLFGGRNDSFKTTALYVLKPCPQTQAVLDIQQQLEDEEEQEDYRQCRKRRLRTEDLSKKGGEKESVNKSSRTDKN